MQLHTHLCFFAQVHALCAREETSALMQYMRRIAQKKVLTESKSLGIS